jgi:hypothetical protein
MTVLEATVRGGQLVLDTAVPLPDGTRVQVRVEPAVADPLLFLGDNAVPTGLRDLADRHDHYIYGTPPELK